MTDPGRIRFDKNKGFNHHCSSPVIPGLLRGFFSTPLSCFAWNPNSGQRLSGFQEEQQSGILSGGFPGGVSIRMRSGNNLTPWLHERVFELQVKGVKVKNNI